MCIPLSLQRNGSFKCIPPFCARQRLGKHVTAATNTCNNRRNVGLVIFCAVRILSKESLWVCLCVPLSLLGNSSVKTLPRQRRFVGGVVFYAVSSRDCEWVCRQSIAASGGHTRLGGRQWPGIAAMKSQCETGTSQRGQEPLNPELKDLRRWGPLPSHDWRHIRLRRLSACCGELQSVWISDSAIINCTYELSFKSPINPITNPNPLSSHKIHDSILHNWLVYQ
jgi:hypothetical protein